MSDRFDLEQHLLDCWKVTDDVAMVCDHVLNEETLDRDKISNALLGLQTIYDMKFEKAWSSFENLVRNKEI